MQAQVEQYNEAMKGEIAVTRRAAYAAEAAVGKLEKEKLEQDFRIDSLQVRLWNCVPFQLAARAQGLGAWAAHWGRGHGRWHERSGTRWRGGRGGVRALSQAMWAWG